MQNQSNNIIYNPKQKQSKEQFSDAKSTRELKKGEELGQPQ
jgi:hypothetical protein